MLPPPEPPRPKDALNDDLRALSLEPESPELGKKRSQRNIAVVLGAAAAAVLVLVVILSSVRSAPARVHLAEATPKNKWAQSVALIATGHVEPERRMFVASQIGGRVKKILVTAGQPVAQNDVVAELDPAFLEAAILENKASLASAKAKVRAARRKAAQEKVRAKKANEGETGVATAIANAQAATAEQRAIEAKMASLKLGLQNTKVRAPMAGRIAKISAHEGQSLAEGTLQIAEIVDTTGFFVDADVSETKLGQLRVGMPADVILDAFANRHFDASVLRVDPEVDKVTSTANVRLRLKNPSSEVLVNMAARVSFLNKDIALSERTGDAKLAVPAECVTERAGKKVVFSYLGGTVQETEVLIGEASGPDIEIVSGLKAQDRVVFSPPPSLSSGDKVEVER
jgi:RND family efflux transporter MFP subunit